MADRLAAVNGQNAQRFVLGDFSQFRETWMANSRVGVKMMACTANFSGLTA